MQIKTENEKLNNIPPQLMAKPNWVGFKVWLDEKENRLMKMPIDIRATIAAKKAEPSAWKDAPAESNNPSTWCSFDAAIEWLKAKKPHKKNAYRIGFAFDGDGIVGIDIDKCVSENGDLSDFAKEVLAAVPSYAEYSPSGTGVHIIVKCSQVFPALKKKEIEIYQSGRFFTMTGNVLPDSVGDVVDCTDAVAALYSKYRGDTVLPLTPKETANIQNLKSAASIGGMSDDEVICRAQESRRQGAKFTALYNGDWRGQGFPSQSEADMALCMSLAFWTGKDFRQIDGIFRRSALYREKWDKVHYAGGVTYGERTVAEAIVKCNSVYKDNGRRNSKSNGGNTGGAIGNIVSGVFVSNNEYYIEKSKDTKRLTNFIIEPIESINVDGERKMTAKLTNVRGNTITVQFRFSDFNSVSALKNAICGNDLRFSILCSDTELQHIKDFVGQLSYPEKRCFKGIGIDFIEGDGGVERPVFVCVDGAFGAGFKAIDSIVQAPDSIKITSGIHNIEPINKDSLWGLGAPLIGFNELPKAAAVLCWCAACFLKPHLMRYEIRFPHLVLTGEAGSGKSTTFAKVVRPLFSLDRPLGVGDITPFTFITDAGSSNFLPLVIEEYKPWAMSKAAMDMIHSGMRNLYDGQSGERGRADLSVRKYYLTSSLILIGESSPNEAAIKERSVELLFSKSDLIDKKDYVAKLDFRKNDIRSFGKLLLLAALEETPCSVKRDFDACLNAVPKEFESRVRNNIAVLLSGLCLLTRACKLAGATFSEVFGIEPTEAKFAVISAVRDYTLEDGKSKSIIEHTLEIMDRMTPEIIKNNWHIRLAPDGKRIVFNFKRIYDPFTQYLRTNNIDAERLNYSLFTKQFRKKDYFAGYENARLRVDGSENLIPVQCFLADAEKLRHSCDVENILAAVGYVPPSPKQVSMFNNAG